MKLSLSLVGIFVVALLLLTYQLTLPIWLPLSYLGFSLVCFTLYGLDKSAARRKRWRIKEKTLHLWALLGGWPGALLAQGYFRHKTQKRSFRLAFWFTVILNFVILWAFCRSEGRLFMQSLPSLAEIFP